MKTLLFAAGENKKLIPLSEQFPSAMTPVANRPVMEFLVEMLARQKNNHFLVSLYTQAGAIENYFRTGKRWGVTLQYDLQRDLAGSAGSIRRFHTALDSTFLFLPADILIDLDVNSALAAHKAQGSSATIITTPGGAQPTGAYLFEPEILHYIPSLARCDIQELLPRLSENGLKVNCYENTGYWNPLDSLDAYWQAQVDLLRAFSPSAAGQREPEMARRFRIEGRQVSPGVWVGKNSAVHPSARLIPPVHIGALTRVGRNVELGPNAIIGHSAMVDDSATIANSVILDNTYVGQYVNVEHRAIRHNLVVDLASGADLRVSDRFLLDTLSPDNNGGPLGRAASRLAGLVLLLASLPLMAVVAALVWLSTQQLWDSWDYIRQRASSRRLQHAGLTRAYRLLRFNARRKDGSIPEVTRWLDRWELLRLPELWNIVKGDIRLVGVHPASVEAAVTGTEPWLEVLRHAQPGFTGMWFVQAPRYCDPLELQIVDVYYTATRSWRKDLRLVLQTPGAWMRQVREWRPEESPQPAKARLAKSTIPLQTTES